MLDIERVSTMQLLCPGGDNGLSYHNRPFPQTAPTNNAEKFTSEMHDPCARSRYLQKRTKQEHLTEGAGVAPAKYPLKVKLEIYSHNSRVIEKGRLCVP